MTMTIDELIEKLEKIRKMCVGNNPVWINYYNDEDDDWNTQPLYVDTSIYLDDVNRVMIDL